MNATFINAAECFAWCIVQVTLFAAVALVVYGLLHRQRASRNVLLLAGSLAIVGVLTLASWSPWPQVGIHVTIFGTNDRQQYPTSRCVARGWHAQSLQRWAW